MTTSIFLLHCGLGFCLLSSIGLPEQPVAPEVSAPPSNEAVGIDVNNYIGYPLQYPSKVTHEAILKWSILTHGDPTHPSKPGAVLENRKDLALGILPPRSRTPLIELPDQQFFFIESGEGRLDNGTHYWDLWEGIGVLIPPGAKHQITNTSKSEPLKLLMLTWQVPEIVTPSSVILVRDVNVLPFTAKGAHWSYMSKNLFAPAHGLHPNELLDIVYLPPMSIAEPHAHIPRWEEIWTKLPPHDSIFMLGSKVGEMPANTAFLVPPNGKTVHAVMNLTKDKTQSWIYLGRHTVKVPNYPREPLVTPKLLKTEN